MLKKHTKLQELHMCNPLKYYGAFWEIVQFLTLCRFSGITDAGTASRVVHAQPLKYCGALWETIQLLKYPAAFGESPVLQNKSSQI
jgi:hypothetical protein